jgi:hypothetical protein
MKKIMLFMLLLINSQAAFLYSENSEWSWDLGSLDIAVNIGVLSENNSKAPGDLSNLSYSFVGISYMNDSKLFSIYTSVIEFKGTIEGCDIFLLPTEVNVNLLIFNPLYVSLYGKAELGFSLHGIVKYFETGLQLTFLPDTDMNAICYSSRNSIYIGMNTNYEIAIGISLDWGLLLLLQVLLDPEQDSIEIKKIED